MTVAQTMETQVEKAGVGLMFQGEHVLAILGGQKTETRRLLHLPMVVIPDRELLEPGDSLWNHVDVGGAYATGWSVWRRESPRGQVRLVCPYGGEGSPLWVRERWRVSREHDRLEPGEIPRHAWIHYEAGLNADRTDAAPAGNVRNPMFMPKWASRVSLVAKRVRLQRLLEITEDDARAEGIQRRAAGFAGGKNQQGGAMFFPTAREAYLNLWDQINAPSKRRGGAYARENPAVWAVTFELVKS